MWYCGTSFDIPKLLIPWAAAKGSANLNDLDARELHRRELAQQYISDVSPEGHEAEIIQEDERIREYEHSRAELMARDFKTAQFKCDCPDCQAKPFQPRYLLKYELHHIDIQEGR